MKAVVGLGNPGIRYEPTKHNVGFRLVNKIAAEWVLKFHNDFRGKIAETRYNEERVLFLKPYTYMNLSGLAVGQMVKYYKLAASDLLVVHDDMDLPLGKIRLRAKGSSGGHKGLKSIISELGTQDFWRLKIGVGRPEDKLDVIDHVLSSFSREEEKIFEEILAKSVKMVFLWLEDKGSEAMNTFN